MSNRIAPGKLRILLCALGCVLLAYGGGMELADYPFYAANPSMAYAFAPSPSPPNADLAGVLPASSTSWKPDTASAYDGMQSPSPAQEQREYADGDPIGGISIPRLSLSAAIVEGSGDAELLLGVGHIRKSALPGELGHIVLAGHRVTRRMHPFRHLELLRPEDAVVIEYEGMLYTYSVIERFIVKQDETWVLDAFDEEHETLTLITCHPPGSLRKRMIVRARLQDRHLIPSQGQGEENHE